MDEFASTLNADCGMDPLISRETSPLEWLEPLNEAPLSRFERLAVRLGAWAGDIAERWAFSSGPFFAFDGRLAAQYDGCSPSIPDA